jgi:hypothetical protein
MQQRGRHTSVTIEELLGNCVFCVIRAESIFRRSESLELAVAAENCIEISGIGSWQLADGEGIERYQLRVENPAVKRSLYV